MTFSSADTETRGSPADLFCYSLPSLSDWEILPARNGAASKDIKENL